MSTARFVQIFETHGKPVYINSAHVIAIRPSSVFRDDGKQGAYFPCCEIVTIDGSIYVNGSTEETVHAFDKATRS